MELKRVYEFPHEIMMEEGKRSISIYMPTHSDSGQWKQDKIRFKNLVSQVEVSLLEDMKKDEVDKLVKPLHVIMEDSSFWNSVSLGLAILLNEAGGIYYILNRRLEEYADVANEFYLKPLLRNFQSFDKFHILGLTRNEFRLYEGTRYSIEEVKLPEGTISLKDDLIDEDAMRGKVLNLSSSIAGGANYHGHNTKDEGVVNVMDTFYRYVDEFVNENYSKPYQKPLILMTTVENQGFFRNLTKNRYLMEKGISKNPAALNLKELQEEFWKLIEPLYLEKTSLLLDRFHDAQGELAASVDPLEIAHGFLDGRVDTLIVEADRVIGAVYDREADKIVEGDLNKYYIGDLINHMALMALKQNGRVVVLPKEKMPSDTGLAAIYRF